MGCVGRMIDRRYLPIRGEGWSRTRWHWCRKWCKHLTHYDETDKYLYTTHANKHSSVANGELGYDVIDKLRELFSVGIDNERAE